MADLERSVEYRPLGRIKSMLESGGFVLAHVYEDLVFVEHNAFFLRMEERGEDVTLFFNEASDRHKREEIQQFLVDVAKDFSLVLSSGGQYRLVPNAAEQTIDIVFLVKEN